MSIRGRVRSPLPGDLGTVIQVSFKLIQRIQPPDAVREDNETDLKPTDPALDAQL